MNARDLTNRLEKYTGSPLISLRQICEMDGDTNSHRVATKYDLYGLPRFGGKRGKFACQDVAEHMLAARYYNERG